MAICPNCNVDVTGSFCPICGLSVAQMGAPISPAAQQPVQQPMQQPGAQPQSQAYQQPYQQPPGPQPGGPPGAYGPPIGVLLGRSQLAKMGIVLMILAIIGLVLAAVVPWISVEMEINDDNESFSFNNDLELVSGDEDLWWDGDEYTSSNDMEDYLKGSIGLAFGGLFLTLLLAIGLIIIGVMAASGKPSSGLLRVSGVIVAALLIIPGAMMIVSGMNFLGFNISQMHSDAVTEELGGEVTRSEAYPAAYLILIFGFIIFLITFIITKQELQKVTPLPQTQNAPPQQQIQPPMQPQQQVPPQYPGGGVHG